MVFMGIFLICARHSPVLCAQANPTASNAIIFSIRSGFVTCVSSKLKPLPLSDWNNVANWDTDVQDDGKIGPNDCVVVLDDDGQVEGKFLFPGGGSSGNSVTLRGEAGGNPVITGFSTVTAGWTNHSGNIYYRAWTLVAGSGSQEGEKCVVKYGSTILAWNPGNFASLSANEWDHDTGNLYINIGQNPDGECAYQGDHKRP